MAPTLSSVDKTLDYDHSIVDAIYFIMLYKVLITFTLVDETLTVRLAPKYFFRLNKSLHLSETHCAFLPLFSPNLDFLQAVTVTKYSHHLSHDRTSTGYGSIPGYTSQTYLHRIKSL